MANLPTLKVLLDNGTNTFPFDITRYVLFTDGYTVSRGRDDWQSAVTAGQLGLALNNSDGRFTPGSTLIASPSPIVVDQRIRLQEIVNGVTYNRFTGYAKSWPVEWPATVPTFSKVRLSATDAQARAERRTLRSSLQEEILADSPAAYYTLGESEGATQVGDSSSRQAPSLAIAGTGTPIVFGNALGPMGLPAAQFAGGQYLSIRTAALVMTGSWTVQVFYSTTTAPGVGLANALVNVHFGADGSSNDLDIGINNAGRVSFTGPVSGGGQSAGVVTDGLVHVAELTYDGTNLRLYDDGVLDATIVAAVAPSAATIISIGGAPFSTNHQSFTGTISQVAINDGAALSGARATAHAAAGHDFVGESGTARMTRLAGYAAIPVGTLDPSLTNMAGRNTEDSAVWPEIQAAADAELGLAFIDGTGSLTFHNRNRVVSKTTPDLTLSSQWVTPDVAPVNDDQQLVNYMEVTAAGTGATAVARNVTSDGSHGRYSSSRSYLVQTDAEALDRANWLVGNLAEPVTRYGTLTINLYGMTPAQASTVIAALDVDCWLRVTSMASQNPGGATADVIVQAWQENANSDTWTITCNVVARSLFAGWILDDPVYSILGSTTTLYV